MKKHGWLATVALLGVLVLVAAACSKEEGGGATPSGATPSERVGVTVYFQGALTGDYNYLVTPSYQAAQLRFKELNADSSYPATITLVGEDTQGDPANAPPVVEEVVGDPDAVAVIGPAFSGESEASGDTYNEAGIPFVTPSATNPGLAEKGWTYWYRGVANDSGQGALAGQYIADVIKAKKVFVVHDKGTYGQGLAQIVRDTLTSKGVDVASFEGIESGSEDFSALVTKVQASGADFLFFGGYDADFGKIVKQARDAGVDIGYMSADGSTSSTFLQLAGDAANGVNLICPCNISGDFSKKYNAEYGGAASAVPVYAAEGYDVASMIGDGIKTAIEGGATAPADIRAGIKTYLDGLTIDSPYQGVGKQIAFDPTTHELAAADPSSLYYFYKVENGKIESLGSAADVLGG
jgi:branched-chain amino acid transport system substrate-binding protein